MIQHTLINDYEEKYAPPDSNVLRVAVSGDVAFLEIGSYDETNREAKFTRSDNEDNSIGVPLHQLVNALLTAWGGELDDQRRRQEDAARRANAS